MPRQSAIERTIDRWYNDLDRLETKSFKALSQAYKGTLASLDAELARYALNPGRDQNASYIRLQEISRQVRASYDAFGMQFVGILDTNLSGAAASGASRGYQMMEDSFAEVPEYIRSHSPVFGSFTRVSDNNLRVIAGFLQDGSPLASIGASFGAQGAADFSRILTTGIATGRSPARIARELRQQLGMSRSRAETITRTEMMRVSRETKRTTWQKNADVLKGWRWSCALDSRSCPVCWAMHNSIHPLEMPMASHPRCRCAMVPVPKSLKELGIMADDPPLPAKYRRSGEEFFRDLPPATQQKILGGAAYRAYRDGAITLNDLVSVTYDPQWGFGRTTKSLKGALGSNANRYYARAGGGAKRILEEPGSFTSSANAHAWAKAKYPHIEFEIENMDVEQLNVLLKQWDTLATDYPDIAKKLEYFGDDATRGQRFSTLPGYDSAMAFAESTGRGISFNPKYYYPRPGERLPIYKTMQDCFDSGWLASSDTAHVMTHEFGHQVHNWLLRQTDQAIMPLLADGTGQVSALTSEFLKTHLATRALSGYATTKDVESFAEGFAWLYHGTGPEPEYVGYLRELLTIAGDKSQWQPITTVRDLPIEERAAAYRHGQRIRKRLGLRHDADALKEET